MKYLIINTGSASKKYAVYEDDKRLYHAHFEMEDSGYVVTETYGDNTEKTPISGRVFEKAQARLLESLVAKKIINSRDEISAIGIRIVAPGEYFLEHKIIDKAYLKMAKQALEKVPLHLGSALE